MMAKQASSQRHGWWIVTGIGLAAAGCVESADAPTRLDDIPLTCAPDTRTYRLTSVDPSVRAAEAIDLDGDGVRDNLLGSAHDLVSQLSPEFAVAPRLDARLAGDVPWLITLDRCGDEVRVTIDRGVQLHAGDDGLLAAKVLPRAVGTVRGDRIEARDGVVRFPLTALADALGNADSAGWTEGDGLIVRATLDGDVLAGVLAAAIETATARTRLAPPIAAFLTAQPADHLMKQGADLDRDGVVTADELTATATFQGLVQGDVIVTDDDGIPRTGTPASSLALRFTAVRIR
jgi:hypothetical protein